MKVLLFVLLLFTVCKCESYEEYMSRRNASVEEEVDMSLAGNVVLSAKEIQANNILTALQAKEVVIMGDKFPPSLNFFDAHPLIDNTSIVFPIINSMPKGSVLHMHLNSAGSYEYLVYNISYKYPCYQYNGNGEGEYEVGAIDCFGASFIPADGPWIALSTLRSQNSNFDVELLANLTLNHRDYGDYYQIWDKFDFIFGLVDLMDCKEVLIDYLLNLFEGLQQDNIQHAEFRTGQVLMHDLENNTYTFAEFIQLFQEVAVQANFSAKIIYADFRKDPAAEVLQDMYTAVELVDKFPETVIGFDLDGPEDEGNSLIFYINEFLQVLSNNTLHFYFHAGESIFTNNTNLYDALLLNTTRIGHGFQLDKHPVLLEEVQARGIAIEVCPISNQILELSPDLRTHPGFDFFNRGIPITISSDDPAIYGYEGTSYDFYQVFMAWGLDIRGLKQLAINSLEYSAWFDDTEKELAYNQWESAWNVWIDSIITTA